MNNLDNYIYYTICEKSYMLFETSKFNTYRSFCNSLKSAIKLNSFSKRECGWFFELNLYLNLIYGFDKKTSSEYVFKYFYDEKYLIFEESVRLMRIYFKNSFN